MAKITIEADNPEELLVFVRKWLDDHDRPGGGAPGGADEAKIEAAVKALYGPISRRFLREVAEASMRGETVTVNNELAQRYEFTDARSLGGAIGAAATGLYKRVGRWVLDRPSRYPSVWAMKKGDAEVVLGVLDERSK